LSRRPKDPPSWLLVSALGAASACTFHPEFSPQTVTVLTAPSHLATLVAAVPARDAEPSLDERCDEGDTGASAPPAAVPGTHVVGPINVYGGTVYFGPVTNVFVGQPGQLPAQQ
jgi:hypothetical protein